MRLKVKCQYSYGGGMTLGETWAGAKKLERVLFVAFTPAMPGGYQAYRAVGSIWELRSRAKHSLSVVLPMEKS